MHELYSQILSYIPMLWRRRWLVLVVAWLVCAVGWITVALIPDKYTSSARIYVDTNSLLKPLLRGLAVETDTARELAVMQRTLISRPNLEEVIRVTDLDLTVKDSLEMERLVARLEKTIKITAERNNLFTIAYEHVDPQVAKNIVQALLTIYVESNLGASRRGMDTALRFIDEQIRNYEKQLDESEQRLARFKQANVEFLPGTGNYHQRLAVARERLGALQANLADAATKRDELRRQLASVPEYLEFDSADSGSGGPESGLQLRVFELEKAIDDLLLRYTEQHPDVIAARKLLKTIRKQLEDEMETFPTAGEGEGATGPGSPKSTNSVPNQIYQEIKLQVLQVEAEIATLKAQTDRQAAKIAKLETMANKIPEVEAQFTKLNRDYDIIKSNYETLLGRKESAQISENRDTKGEKVQFRIIDPPRVPLIPTNSNRRLYLLLVLLGGIGAGVGIGWVVASLRRAYFSAWALSQEVVPPVLGSVSMYYSSAQQRWRRLSLASYCAVSLALLGVFGGLQVVEMSVGLPRAVPDGVVEKAVQQLPKAFSDLWEKLGIRLSDKI